MFNKKTILGFLLAVLVFAPSASVFADFNASKLIDDKVFSDTQTFGSAAGIQQFLVSKGSMLARTDTQFLLLLKEPQDSSVKTGLGDPQPNLGRLRTAAELIWDASVKSGMNPQVIIVTLQKEQSLINGNFSGSKLQRALDHSLGFGCPDSGGCDQIFLGFYAQLFGGFDAQGNRYVGAPGSLMRSFNTPGGRGPAIDAQGNTSGSAAVRISRVNDVITLTNTLGGPQNPQPQQTVTLLNSATAALYRYTPHVYNGNYNFWKFFDEWFRYPNGTLIKVSSDNTIYIINNGLRSAVPGFVAQARGLNLGATVIVSPTELSSIDAGAILGPADNVIIKVDTDPANKLYVFANNKKHPVSSFVLKQRGLSATKALTVSQGEADLFATASLLTPKDGTLLVGENSKTVYLIQNSQKMALTGFTFKQYAFSFKNVITLPQDEIDAYSGGGFLLPKNGTLVKFTTTPTLYLLGNNLLHPISDTVFKLKKFSMKNVVSFSADELGNANVDGYVAPPDNTYFKLPDGSYYLYKNGTKHYISQFVLKQRAVVKEAVLLLQDEGSAMSDGLPLSPVDGTLIKGDASAAIYVIQKGQKIPLDGITWKKKYRSKAPTILGQSEVDGYPSKGQIDQ